MKTNNVDFGKSFKFKTCTSKTYTCHAVNANDNCKITWTPIDDTCNTFAMYKVSEVIRNINSGSWTILPTTSEVLNTCEVFGPEIELKAPSQYPIKFDTGNLLDQIKDFTANSKHSVNIYEGVYEVFRAGENVAYQCKDEEVLKKVMEALKVLDGVSVDEANHE